MDSSACQQIAVGTLLILVAGPQAKAASLGVVSTEATIEICVRDEFGTPTDSCAPCYLRTGEDNQHIEAMCTQAYYDCMFWQSLFNTDPFNFDQKFIDTFESSCYKAQLVIKPVVVTPVGETKTPSTITGGLENIIRPNIIQKKTSENELEGQQNIDAPIQSMTEVVGSVTEIGKPVTAESERRTASVDPIEKLIIVVLVACVPALFAFTCFIFIKAGSVYKKRHKSKLSELRTKPGVDQTAELETIAEEIIKEWKTVATHLGYSRKKIMKFLNDNNNDDVLAASAMLKDHHLDYSNDGLSSKQALAEALKKAKRQDLSSRVLDKKRGTDISDKVLRDIASEMGGDWPQLATYLGIQKAEIDCLKLEGRGGSTVDVIFEMLATWRQRQPLDVDLYATLTQALVKADRNDLATSPLVTKPLETSDSTETSSEMDECTEISEIIETVETSL